MTGSKRLCGRFFKNCSLLSETVLSVEYVLSLTHTHSETYTHLYRVLTLSLTDSQAYTHLVGVVTLVVTDVFFT